MDFIYLYETELQKPLAIASSGVVRGLRVRDEDGDVTSVQCKSNQNCKLINNLQLKNKTAASANSEGIVFFL
jgi:hypothetical protein